MLRHAMLCYAILRYAIYGLTDFHHKVNRLCLVAVQARFSSCLLACLLAAAAVSVSTEPLQEHNMTDVPRGTSVTERLL
jgi:hypothetical protein